MPTVATSDFPSLTVRFLSDQGPAATNGTWVDITDFVAAGTVARGRQYETDRFDAARCSVILKTTTRQFDPDFSTGAYFGNLLPMRQLEITSTWSPTTYSVFRGYITSWGNTVQDNKLWSTQIEARDGFLVLEQAKLTTGPYESQVVALGPDVYYRFDDANTLLDSSGNANHGTWGQTPTLTTGLLTGDPSSAWEIDEESPMVGRGVVTLDASVAHTVDFWFSTTATEGTLAVYKNNNITVIVYLSAGKLRIWNSGTNFYSESDSTLNDGLTHYVQSEITNLTIDDVLQSGSGGPTTPAQFTAGMQNGQLILGDCVGANDPYAGTLDEFALYAGTSLASNYPTGLAPWEGDDTGTRIGRILDLVSWPAGLRDIDTGSSIMQAFDFQLGMSALDAIRQASDTELGQTYIDGSGDLVHRSRASIATETRSRVSQAVFGDGTSTSSLQFDNDGFSFPRDETLIRNPVTASRANGISVTVKDQILIDDKYGNRGWNAPTAYDSSDTVMADRAYYLLGRYKDLGTRLESARFTPRANPSNLWPQVLGREIGDRFTVARTPLGSGNQIVKEQILERIEHRFSVGPDWRTNLVGSPATATNEVPFIWNDATYGKWDTAKWGY